MNKLIQAFGMIENKYIEEADEMGVHRERMYPRMFQVKYVVMAALVILAVCVSALTVSAQIRQWVMELFHVGVTEVVPEPTGKNEDMTIYASKEIGKLFDVQYIESEHYFDAVTEDGDLFCQWNHPGRTYYTLVENQYEEVSEVKTVRRKIDKNGIKGTIEYDLVKYNGKTAVCEQTDDVVDSRGKDEQIEIYSEVGKEWIECCKSMDTWSYRLELEPITGKTRDVFKDIKINGRELRDYPLIQNWQYIGDGQMIVMIGKTNEVMKGHYYLINYANGQVTDLQKETGISHILSVRPLKKNLIFVTHSKEKTENINCYRYNMDTKKCTVLYENAVLFDQCKSMSIDDTLKVGFTGKRYDLLYQAGICYVADELTGTRRKIEGMNSALAERPAASASGNKMVVSVSGEGSIPQFVVIDMVNNTCYALKRINQSEIEEWGMGFCGEQVVIMADKEDKYYMYIYSQKDSDR